jgi:hypothetical protein
MNYRHALAVTALAAGLSGCASMSTNYQSNVRYQDGSYYSPAEAGYGDYYYAPEPRYDYYYDHSYFYGSSFYSFGAPCSFRYRYCSPFGYDPFYSFGWYGWYDPFWPYYAYYWQHHGHHSDNGHDDDDDDDPATTPTDQDGNAAIADWAAMRPGWRTPGRMMAAPETERDPNAGFPRSRSDRPRRESVSAPVPSPRRSESSSASEERSSASPSRSIRHRGERND